MIKGEYDYLKELAKLNLCSEHGMPLEVATHPEDATYVLHCGEGHYPDAIVPNPSVAEMYKQGELPEGPIADKVKKGIKKRAALGGKEAGALTVGQAPNVDLGTGERLDIEIVAQLLDYAYKYALDPYRAHVCLIHGKPYITLDGYLWHANRSKIPFKLASRPLTTEERGLYKVGENDHAWLSEVIIQTPFMSFSGVGVVTEEEMQEEAKGKPGQSRYPVVATKPWQMAQRRAEWQALKRAFPIGEPKE